MSYNSHNCNRNQNYYQQNHGQHHGNPLDYNNDGRVDYKGIF